MELEDHGDSSKMELEDMSNKTSYFWVDQNFENKPDGHYRQTMRNMESTFKFFSNIKDAMAFVRDHSDGRFVVISSGMLAEELSKKLLKYFENDNIEVIVFTSSKERKEMLDEKNLDKAFKFIKCVSYDWREIIDEVNKSRNSTKRPDSTIKTINIRKCSILSNKKIDTSLKNIKLSNDQKKFVQQLPQVLKSDFIELVREVPKEERKSFAEELIQDVQKSYVSISSNFDSAAFNLWEKDEALNWFKKKLFKFAPIFRNNPEEVKKILETLATMFDEKHKHVWQNLADKNSELMHGEEIYREPLYLKVFSGKNGACEALNLEFRRLSHHFRKLKGYTLSEYDQTELGDSNPTDAIEQWMHYIIGCLSNYSHLKDNNFIYEKEKDEQNKDKPYPLKRGYEVKHQNLEEYAKQFPVGKIFYWPAFTSTSKGAPFNRNIQCHIEPLSKSRGLDISSVSSIPGEQEVLFPPFTWFKVVKIEITENKVKSRKLHLYLDEQPLSEYISDFNERLNPKSPRSKS